MISTKFTLSNLHCEACGKVSRIKIASIPGVETVTINQQGNQAEGAALADRPLSILDIQQALAGTPYQVRSAELTD